MAKKPRRSAAGYQRRRVDTRAIRQRFLIVCEGEKTEPLYFDAFRAPTVAVKVLGGERDPHRLVEKVIAYRERFSDDFDQVWCVFDRDEVPAQRFNEALKLARRQGFRVAYSNPAFELWLLLHFEACSGALSRRDYGNRLGDYLERTYQKNDERLMTVLAPREGTAIDRAERLLAGYVPCRPADDDPSTTVHLLVKELRRFAAP